MNEIGRHRLIWPTGIAFLLVALVAGLFPVFPRGYEVMDGWVDQKAALALLQTVLAGDSGHAMGASWAGPGWLALAKLSNLVFGLDARSALIFVNRLCYLFAAFIFCHYTFRQLSRVATPLLSSLSAIVVVTTFFFSVNFTYFSTVAWSHFVALPFACLALSLFDHAGPSRWGRHALIGLSLGFLASIRMFSVQAFLFGVLLWASHLTWKRRKQFGAFVRTAGQPLGIGALGFGVGYFLHGLILGKVSIFLQYQDVVAYPISELMKLRLTDLPVKLIQLFVDPCFLADCSLNAWTKGSTLLVSDGIGSFYYPLILQIPMLGWVLVVCLVGLALCWRRIPALLEDPVVAIGLLTAGALIVGYSSALVAGSDRLKYGYVRDFMEPMFLVTMATIRAMSLYSGMKPGSSWKPIIFASLAAPAISVLGLQYVVSRVGFVSFPDYAIERLEADVDCEGDSCSLRPFYVTRTGRTAFPRMFDDAVMKITCAEGGEPAFWYGNMANFQYRKGQCRDGASIVFAPTITGGALKVVQADFGGRVRIDWFPPYRLGDQINFAATGNATQYLHGNWSVGETSWRWTDGNRAGLVMSVAPERKSALELRAKVLGYVRQNRPKVDVDIRVNGMIAGHWSIGNAKEFADHSVKIPVELIPSDGRLDFEFIVRNPASPRLLGESSDSRLLGLAFQSVVLGMDPDR